MLRRLLTGLLLAAAFYFLARTAATNWAQLESHAWEADPVQLLLSVAAHVGVLCWGVFLWSQVLRRFDTARPPFPALLKVWALSNAARYVPGSVWQFVAAAQLSGDVGLPRVLALSSMLVHVGFSLLAAAVLSVLVLPLETLGLAAGLAQGARLGVPVLALAAVHPAVLNGLLRLIPRALHRDVVRWSGRWLDGAALLLLSLASWLLYGGAYYLFVDALVPVSAAALPVLAGVNALSFLVGYIVLFAPGGLGVRESAMTLLLAPVVPLGVAAIVAIAARLWSVVAEVVLAVGAALLARRGARAGGREPRAPLRQG